MGSILEPGSQDRNFHLFIPVTGQNSTWHRGGAGKKVELGW